MDQFRIEMEDATRYLPHSPSNCCYQYFVYRGTELHPITGKEQPRLVYSGTKDECERFVSRNSQDA